MTFKKSLTLAIHESQTIVQKWSVISLHHVSILLLLCLVSSRRSTHTFCTCTYTCMSFAISTLNIYVQVHCMSTCIVAFPWLKLLISLTCHWHVSILCGESSMHISSQAAWSGKRKELFCMYTILVRHNIALLLCSSLT